MQIDKKILNPENYKGFRKIIILNSTVKNLKNEINKLQKQANPILKNMEKISKSYENEQNEILKLQSQINDIKAKIKPDQDKYNIELEKLKLLDAKADLIKNKIYPIVQSEIDGKLDEFEEARDIIEEKGVIYIKIYDKIEEYIKSIRTKNAVVKKI